MTLRSMILPVLLLAAACAPVSTPRPPAPAPAPSFCVAPNVHVDTVDGPPVAGAHVFVAGATGDTNAVGYLYLYPITAGSTTISVTADGYEPAGVPYTVDSLVCDVAIALHPTFRPLPRLRIRGEYFELETGARFRGIEASDFNLFDVWLHDKAQAARVAAQRRALGFNMLRVFTRYVLDDAGIGTLTIAQHPDLYERWPEFLRFAASYGFYVNALAYPGGPPTQDWDAQHWAKLCAAGRGETNFLPSLVNENNVHAAKVDTDAFQPCSGALSSHGSNGSRSAPVLPVWDWAEAHWNTEIDWMRQIGHNGWEFAEQYHVAIHSDESRRAPDEDANEQHWVDGGGNAGLFVAAATFHSNEGKNSTLFSPLTEQLARAFVAGMSSTPLECQGGPYRHRDDIEQRLFTDQQRLDGARVHQLGSDDRCISVVHQP